MIPLVAPCHTAIDEDMILRHGFDDLAVTRFEEQFAQAIGARGAVAVCSGTIALQALFETFDLETIIIPAFSCSALTNAATAAPGAYYHCDSWYDVGTATLKLLNPTSDHDIVLPHMFGREAIFAGDPVYPAYIIHDITHSVGAVQFNNDEPRLVGVCSTHASKMISTQRGGLVFANDPELLQDVRDHAYYDNNGGNGRAGATSVGMTALQAALGTSQLEQLHWFVERRREIAGHYGLRFVQAGIEAPLSTTAYPSTWFRYIIRVNGNQRDNMIRDLAELGIEAGRGIAANIDAELFPCANWDTRSLLSVPCHPSLTSTEVEHIAESVLKVCAPK